MEFIVEIIFDLLFDGTMEILPNEMIPKWVRYPFGIVVGLLIATIIIGLILLGLDLTDKSLSGGVFIAAVGIVMLICLVFKFIKIKRNKQRESIAGNCKEQRGYGNE